MFGCAAAATAVTTAAPFCLHSAIDWGNGDPLQIEKRNNIYHAENMHKQRISSSSFTLDCEWRGVK